MSFDIKVPIIPTKKMIDAACQAMRKRREEMGEMDWFPVSNRQKAGIRWAAMLQAWIEERGE